MRSSAASVVCKRQLRHIGALNPIDRKDYNTLTLAAQDELTGLEGYKILEPTTEVARGSFIPRDCRGTRLTLGIQPSSFTSTREHVNCLYQFIKDNPRHFRVLELVDRLGHTLKDYPPPPYSDWDEYWDRAPE